LTVPIDKPEVFIPWDIDEKGLEYLLVNFGLKKVTDGYYCISCKSFGGLHHELGFHFEKKDDEKESRKLENYAKSIGKILKTITPDYNPKRDGKLKELEFYRKSYPDLKKSFDEFQSYFENEFGKPTQHKTRRSGFYDYEWKLNGVIIYHYIYDRFGPEEHLRIKKCNYP
jgi:hypothetical protein